MMMMMMMMMMMIPNLEDIQLLFEIFSNYCVLRPSQANQVQYESTFLSSGPQFVNSNNSITITERWALVE